jgi:acetylornithine deacetylase
LSTVIRFKRVERLRGVTESAPKSRAVSPSRFVSSRKIQLNGIRLTDVFELTRALVDIESITGNEAPAASLLYDRLGAITRATGGSVERMDVEGSRFNVLASWGDPVVTFSTHIDTVPPFFPSREDATHIWGRGSCDAKGIIAAMSVAAENLAVGGTRGIALLVVVGEERNSAGARAAARVPRGSQYLVNGEPTESKLALGSKGVLRFEVSARGRAAHSAYPELGRSAIESLLDVLDRFRKIPLPTDPLFGASTMNIGTISGGHAPNVIADSARAEIMIRLVGDAAPVRAAFRAAAAAVPHIELAEVMHNPAMRMESLDGYPTTVVAFGSDIPDLSPAWGRPLMFGPGSIHLAHTEEERIPKQELLAAVGVYENIARTLLARNARAGGGAKRP